MLDTDICIYIIKRRPETVQKRFEQLDPSQLTMSAITFAELVNGAKKSQQVEANLTKLTAISELLLILPFDRAAALAYGDVRSSLEKRGAVIGSNDLLIASHALSVGCTLVTNNEREFSRVEGLQIDNWVRTLEA